jgi:hypothetical protein
MTSKVTLVIALSVASCFIWIAPAALAQAPSQGRVVSDGATIWRADVSIVAATARAGTTLDITAQSERWYEVIVPEALGGRGERGLIARSQVQLLPGSPEPPNRPLRGSPAIADPRVPPQGAVAVRRTPAFPRGFLSLNGAYQTTSNDFRETVTFRENAEDGRFDADYTVRAAPGLNMSGGGMISPTMGVGAAISRFARSTPSAFSGSVPHPFFFNAPRSISAEIAGLKREEWAVHAQMRGVFPASSQFQMMVFGGPSLFRVKQGIVADFSYADSYPYDEATFQTAEVISATKSTIGFNVGGDVAFFFTRQVGIGFTAMFSRATVDLPVDDGRDAQVRAGGMNTGGGLRLRF